MVCLFAFFPKSNKDLGFVVKVLNKKCSLGQWIQRLPHQTVITSPAPPFLRQLKFSLLTKKNWFWRLIVPCSTVLVQSEIQRGQLSFEFNRAVSLWYSQGWSSSARLFLFLSWLKAVGEALLAERGEPWLMSVGLDGFRALFQPKWSCDSTATVASVRQGATLGF